MTRGVRGKQQKLTSDTSPQQTHTDRHPKTLTDTDIQTQKEHHLNTDTDADVLAQDTQKHTNS